jgi:uncharacterized protein HemX
MIIVLLLIAIFVVLSLGLKVKYLSQQTNKIDLIFADPTFISEQAYRQTLVNQINVGAALLDSQRTELVSLTRIVESNRQLLSEVQNEYDSLKLYLSS